MTTHETSIKETDRNIADALLATINLVKGCKPQDRSETDRAYAVTVTMLEQAYAYFATYVIGAQPQSITWADHQAANQQALDEIAATLGMER